MTELEKLDAGLPSNASDPQSMPPSGTILPLGTVGSNVMRDGGRCRHA